MLLSPLVIRTVIYLIRTVSATFGKGVIDSEANKLVRDWVALLHEEGE